MLVGPVANDDHPDIALVKPRSGRVVLLLVEEGSEMRHIRSTEATIKVAEGAVYQEGKLLQLHQSTHRMKQTMVGPLRWMRSPKR